MLIYRNFVLKNRKKIYILAKCKQFMLFTPHTKLNVIPIWNICFVYLDWRKFKEAYKRLFQTNVYGRRMSVTSFKKSQHFFLCELVQVVCRVSNHLALASDLELLCYTHSLKLFSSHNCYMWHINVYMDNAYFNKSSCLDCNSYT